MKSNMRGFTLVELSIAMTFLSILLLAIAMLTLQISSIYNKGLTLRAVNESGQLLSSEIQRTLNQSDPKSTMAVIKDVGGRLCAGTTVYAWNHANKFDDPAAKDFNIYPSGGSVSERTKIRFSKFSAKVNEYCEDTDPGADGEQYMQLPERDTMTDLLSQGGNADLVLRGFEFDDYQISTADGKQTVYRIVFTLGTNTNSIINDVTCDASKASKLDSEYSRVDDEYCAVNKFTITARAGRIYEN